MQCRERDRWAKLGVASFDLWARDDVAEHSHAILERPRTARCRATTAADAVAALKRYGPQGRTGRIFCCGAHFLASPRWPRAAPLSRRVRPFPVEPPSSVSALRATQGGKVSRAGNESGRWSMPPNSGTMIDLMCARRSVCTCR